MDSIQGKLDQFNNAVQSMWSNTLDSDWVKDIVDFGTEIIKLIDNIGVLRIAVAAFITYVAKKWGGLDFSAMFSGLTEKGINKIFGKSVNQNIDATTSKLEELEQAVKRAKQAYVDDGGSKASQKALRNAEEQLETYKKIQKEGFNPSDKSKGYFGTEIQKIKDYKQELAGLETTIPEAEQALLDAESELNYMWSQGEFGDVDIDEYIDKVDKAKLHVQDLKKKHSDLKKSGSGAFQSLADGANALTKQIQSAVTSMLVMYAISKAMQIISDLWDAAFETADEAKEAFEDLSSELETTKSELNTLESQLQDVKSQIEDINANTPLTFTDEEELSRLEAQSAELQRQIDLLETIEREQSKGVNNSAINAAQKYSQTGVSTGKTTGENVGEKAGSGAAIGAGVGVATGVGGAILTSVGAGATLGAWAGPVGMLIGAAIGAIAGAAIGAVVGGIESASEETVGESLNNMKDQYAKLQSEFETARKNYTNDASSSNKKKFEEAQEALNNYQSNMANYISEMDTYYGQIKQNWDTATTEQKAEYAEWADTMDAWAIQSNGTNAKSNAIERIFGENAEGGFATAKAQIEAINAEIKEAQESGDEVAIANAFEKLDGFTLDVLSDEEVDRLYNMGIYLHEADDYFKKVVKAGSEFVDVGLYDVVTDINKITDGLESMKTAFDEIIERGSVTAKTMASLNETFSEFNKTTDGAKAWLNYSNTVFSGAASIEQMTKATEEYVKAYLDYELAPGNLDPENKWTYVIQLQSLGVENAQEYVDELLQKNLVDELSNEYSLDIDVDSLREAYDIANMDISGRVQPFEDLDDTQRTKLAEEYGLINDLSDEAKTEIAERYGVEEDAIDDIIGKLKLKQKAESTLSQAEQKQADYDTFLDKYEKAKQDLEQAQKGVGEYTIAEVGGYTVDGWYYNGEYYNDPKTIVTAIDQEALYIAQEAYDKIKAQYSQYFDEQGNLKTTVPTEIAIEIKNAQSALDKAVEDLESLSPEMQLKLDLQDFDDGVDTIQSAYSTLKDTVAEYNSQGFLSLDNLQAILNLQPEYLSCLQMENGQLTINQSALEAMLKTKLADAKATAIQSAITQLNTLAERKEALVTNDTALAASNASLAMGSYTGTLSTFTSQAIVAAGAAETLRAALEGAEGNQYVNQEEIAQVWANLENSLSLIQSLEDALPDSFNQILDPGSNTAEEETAEVIEDKIQEGWEALLSKYENELALITNERDLIQAEIDNMEAQGGKASAKYYDDLIRNSNEEQELLEQKLVALQEYLNANKDAIDQDTWAEYNSEINETAVAIKECTKNTLEWKEALRDIAQHYFDQATDEISRLKEELEFVDGLLEDEDVADENGNWSSAALTRLGMYTNQLELAAAEAARYKEEIAKLDKQYKEGELSEEQYQEALSEAVSGQQSAIQSYEDAKDSIVELNEARIDAIKDGIEKEIEAFKDLTDAKKKELEAERDLYDFRKNINKQTKDISELERRISALSGSTAASDIAERRKLEQQLMEAKEGLNDTYYDHSRTAQDDALDAESEAYTLSKEKYIEQLEDQLEDTQTLIENSIMDVLLNADTVYTELNNLADIYGVDLSDSLTQPWKAASAQAIAWKDELGRTLSASQLALITHENGAVTAFSNGVATKLTGTWTKVQAKVKDYSDYLTGSELSSGFSKTLTGFGSQIQKIIDKWNEVKKAADDAYVAQTREVTVGGNVNYSTSSGSGSSGGSSTPSTTRSSYGVTATLAIGKKTLSAVGTSYVSEADAKAKAKVALMGKYESYQKSQGVKESAYEASWLRSWQNKIKYKTASKYAKGTTGVKTDQLAIIDELGPELVLRANPETGRLDYLTKGTSVIPAEATAELMKIADIGAEGLMMPQFDSGVNVLTNYISKPELNID